MKKYIFYFMFSVCLAALAGCTEEQSLTESVEMKAFVEQHGKTGLTKEEVVAAFGDAQAVGEIGGEEVWLYDNSDSAYDRSFTSISGSVFTDDVVDYQLYISFVNDLAYRYSYIYEKDEEIWQLQLMPGGEKPIHAKVNMPS